MAKKKGKHGGPRPGSGRPHSGNDTYPVRLKRKHAELLSRWGGGSISAGIRWLVEVAEEAVRKVD